MKKIVFLTKTIFLKLNYPTKVSIITSFTFPDLIIFTISMMVKIIAVTISRSTTIKTTPITIPCPLKA